VEIAKIKTLSPPEMEDIVVRSRFSEGVIEKSLSVIRNIFAAEAGAHGKRPRNVHLHELGSADTVIDVVATVVCLDLLGIEKMYCSPVNVGGGFVGTAHGRLPVPAPATALLLKDAPVYSSGIQSELTTPTGAAIAKTLASGFGPMPLMRLRAVGAGAGDRDFKEAPNVLRAFIGEAQEDAAEEEIAVMETNIDDMNPQVYEYVMERVFEAGALDVWLTPVIMKKSRPAVVLSVICRKKDTDALKDIIFRETTTLGIRQYAAGRTTLERSLETEKTAFGPVRFKSAKRGGKAVKTPEYEDCKRIARETGIPLLAVIRKLSRGNPL
jgi:hypothetical protein